MARGSSRVHAGNAVLAALLLLAAACGSGSDASSTNLIDAAGDAESTPPAEVAQDDISKTEAPQTEAPQTEAPQTEAPQTEAASTQADADQQAAEPTPEPVITDPTPPAPAEVVTAQVLPVQIAAPNGRTAPLVAGTPAGLADQVAQAERGLLLEGATPEELAVWGHQHQVAIRKLGYEPGWDIEFFEALPSEFQARTLLHVSARRSLIDLSSGYDAADFIPAWEIVDPETAENLLVYYREAEDATGIEWEFLAAINLIETGMGRIRGLSSAGAQGPMQFLPTTWAEAGIGEGDINNPRDAINGAARYLVRRGGPSDMEGALWGYNNSDNYVSAVRAYAELLRQDPAAYAAIYNWEIYFYTEAGDVWLPAGFRSEDVIDLTDYLADNPWSEPDPGLR